MKTYIFGNDTLKFDTDEDAIEYAESIGATEFKPLDNQKQFASKPVENPQVTLEDWAGRAYEGARLPLKVAAGLGAMGGAVLENIMEGKGLENVGERSGMAYRNVMDNPDQNIVTSLATSPLNYVAMAPAASGSRMLGNLAKKILPTPKSVEAYIAESPMLSNFLYQGTKSAGITLADQAANPNIDISPVAVIGSGLTGGVLGAGQTSISKSKTLENINELLKKESQQLKDAKKLGKLVDDDYVKETNRYIKDDIRKQIEKALPPEFGTLVGGLGGFSFFPSSPVLGGIVGSAFGRKIQPEVVNLVTSGLALKPNISRLASDVLLTKALPTIVDKATVPMAVKFGRD